MSKRTSDDDVDDPLWNDVMKRAENKKQIRLDDEGIFIATKLPPRPDLYKDCGVESFISVMEDAFNRTDSETPFINSPMFKGYVAIGLDAPHKSKWWDAICAWTVKVDNIYHNKKYTQFASCVAKELRDFRKEVQGFISAAWLKAHPKFTFEWRTSLILNDIGEYMVITPKPRPSKKLIV